MHDLQLVGLTTDRRGLIFRPRAGARTDAGFVVPVTDDLVALVSELAEELAAAEPPATDPPVDASAAVAAAEVAAKPRSQMSVRDIQARLRAGEPVAQVAREAGVDEDWIERFAPPIRAEQRRIVDRALEHHLQRSRSAPSAVPLRRAVGMALAEKGIAYTVAAFDAAWSAHLLGHDRWAVAFTYRHRGRDRTATWTYDAADDELTTSDRTAAQLGYVAPGAAGDEDGQAIDGIIGDPEASNQIGTASPTGRTRRGRSAPSSTSSGKVATGGGTSGRAPAKPKAAPAGRTAAKKKAAAGRPASKKTATKKTAAAKKAAAKKKTATKRTAAAKKVAAKEKATTKRTAAAKKAAAKKRTATKRTAAAKKAAAKKKTATKRTAIAKKAAAKTAVTKTSPATKKATTKRTATAAAPVEERRAPEVRVDDVVAPTSATPDAGAQPLREADAAIGAAAAPAPSTEEPAPAAASKGSEVERAPAGPRGWLASEGGPSAAPSRLPDEAPRPSTSGPRGDERAAPTRPVAGRPGQVPLADVPLARRPPVSNGRAGEGDGVGAEADDQDPGGDQRPRSTPDPASARRARAAERNAPTVQFRSGSAAPVRASAAPAEGPIRRSPEPQPTSDRSRTEPGGSNGAARPATRRRRQLRAR